jgi:hypothetical protein
VNGNESFGQPGDTLTVPRGARHIAYNDKNEPLVCTVVYRPGLDHYTTMQCFAGLTLDGYLDGRGLVSIPRILYLLKRANVTSLPRPSLVPEAVFRLGMQVFYLIGKSMGWEALYRKYTRQ